MLQNIRLKCQYESPLNCISKDGNAVLARFAFDSVNPYEHMMVSVRLGHDVLSNVTLLRSKTKNSVSHGKESDNISPQKIIFQI